LVIVIPIGTAEDADEAEAVEILEALILSGVGNAHVGGFCIN